MVFEGKVTTDKNIIKKWAEARNGWPALIKQASDMTVRNLLRIGFSNNGEEDLLEKISWEEFFDRFERERLAFLYQEQARNGALSTAYHFI